MNYDSMSVHELVGELAELGTGPVVRFEPIDWDTVALLESDLRKAVIREASVGTLTCHAGMFGQTYGDKPITSFNEGDKYALVLLPKEE